ncbi:MAG TPA: response regulator, partial [Nitrospira sp.]|nr:response regulator [Nitrospira sp.]
MPKILVADDSIAVRKVAERLLTEAGLGVTLAANGEEALAFLAKDRPDVIVSDVIMPDKSGYEICAFVRGNSMLAATPVLLISGIVNDEVTKQAEACRADGILKKPFQGTSLKDRVMELLAKRQAPAPVAAPTATRAHATEPAPAAGHGLRITSEGQAADHQTAMKLAEVEEKLHAERTRGEQLAARITELEEEIKRGKDSESLLETERCRVKELEAQVKDQERQAASVPQLEAALKAEQETVAKLKLHEAAWQKTSGRVTELEATLEAERAAAAQLVQQLGDRDEIAARVKTLEAQLEQEGQRASDLQQKAHTAETALTAAQARVSELAEKVSAAERVVQRKGELEVLL